MKPLVLLMAACLLVVVPPARAARLTYEPVSDGADGQLVDGSGWDWKPSSQTLNDLLLLCGQEAGSTYEDALGFPLSDLQEGQLIEEARLRLNQQGGVITSGLTIRITAAVDLDPLATPGALRFTLPRTTAKVFWTVGAPFDSSGQRIAKWAEPPDIAAIVEEVVAQPGWDSGPKEILLFLEVSAAAGDNVIRFDDTHAAFAFGGNPGIRPARLIVSETYRDAFWGKEHLCRPRPTSIEVNIIPHDVTIAYIEWGPEGLPFTNSTSSALILSGEAHNFLLEGLDPDTRYEYRLVYRPIDGTFEPGPAYLFTTMPASAASQARVIATADIHVTNQLSLGLDTQMQLLEDTLAYMPDFLAPDRYHVWIDLGDLVVIRAQRVSFDREEVEQRYREAREYIDLASHSLPFILVRGNHEEVNGWDYDGSPDNTMSWSGEMLLKYFPTPLPDEYYSGNETPHPTIGLPGDYFAFNVGAMRFRCLDPYLFSQVRPHNGHGETGGSEDGWDWEFGQQQYDWLYNDMTGHPAVFDVVALHHLTSCYTGVGYYYGRGGVEVVDWPISGRPTFEWGGQDSTGADIIATKRPGYHHGAVHTMLVSTGNDVVLKGHDHFHGRQELDGMIYQTLAKPDATEQHTGDLWGWRYDTFYPDQETRFETNSGFYSIVIDATFASFSYVQTYPTAGLGTIRDSFTLEPAAGLGVPAVRNSPAMTKISKVSPNPAGIPPRIEYVLGRPGPMRLAIYDASGRLVRELESGDRAAGPHDAYWDRKDGYGRTVASGVYFARLWTRERLDAVKLIVVR